MTTTEALAYLEAKGFRLSGHRLRKICERGDMPEAFKAPGGHWDINQSGLDRWIASFAPVRRRRQSERASGGR